MMNNISKFKKTLLLPLSVILISSTLNIQRAQAQVPGVFVPVYSAIEHGTQVTNFAWDSIGQHTLSTLAYTAGQLALDQITQNTISWIQGGFAGSPSFAIDPNKLFLDLADSVAGEFASEVRGLATCNFSPNFNDNLANSLELSTRSNANNKFAAQAQCPFPALSFSASDFYGAGADAFKQNGGWKAMEASLDDAGNPFGMRVVAGQELIARQSSAQKIQEQKSGWSNGFTNLVDTSACTYPSGMDTSFEGVDPGVRASLQQQYCPITTPGKVIDGQLQDALGTDVQRLGFADNLDKLIGALIGQLTQEAITGIFH